ncbi:MAG: hypothetical protein LQ340_002860 [Diploschistes diacapsis]|nr:MAG: hypothetical protein LQ340_002860 [Diploschistes diacapsis]
MPHKAVWLTNAGELEHRIIEEDYHASNGQLLVSVEYSGINPGDLKHMHIGMKDLVVGYDYSGSVIAAPLGSRFAPGDRIAGTTPTGISRGSRCGTHQDVIIAEETMAFAVPASMPMTDAAGLDIILRTAIIALYSRLHLPFPWEPGKPGALLIWGAATGVGLSALQLAAISGAHPIYVTASTKNHAALKELGATHCFDYKSESVFEDIKAAVAASEQPLGLVFDTVGPQPTGHIGDRCFDLVSHPATANVISCGPGGKRATFFSAMPDWDCDVMQPGVGVVWARKNPAEAETMSKVFSWVVDNYGKAFKLPRVRFVPWSEAITELKRSMEWQNSFEKTVIDHKTN